MSDEGWAEKRADERRAQQRDADKATARARRAAAAEGMIGVALMATAGVGVDWRLGIGIAGALLYASATWGKL